MPQPVMLKKLKLNGFYEDLQDLLELTHPKDVLFITGDWNAKVGSQETPGVTGKFGLGAGVQPRWIQGIRRVDGVGVERLVYLLM